MSLILEALRKSEAERRRAQAPDLFAPVQAATAPARRWPVAWLAAGIGVLLLALVLAAIRMPGDAAPAGSADAIDNQAAPPRAPTVAPAADAPDAPRRLPGPAASGAIATPPAAAASVATAPARTGGDEPAAAPFASAAPGPASATAPPVPPAEAQEPRRSPEPAATAHATPAAPDAADAGAPPADTSGPLRLAELAPAARRELPPLKLSMHMWNEAPAQRFVILDGRRLGEGDRLGALRVAEIRRDGVLLDWNGRPLLMPLR